MPKGQQRKIKYVMQYVMYQSIVINHVTYYLVPLKDLVLFFWNWKEKFSLKVVFILKQLDQNS